ncbi:4-coumarate--CoA ligase-like [Papaver somniferum]|uniref:4-coumarate--CoA ligase-like n=1 Tax=Papaver somniferum TaxID=3469 RepID=UPI000E6FDB13|nr:4-coumarate--CoA ligase-like [Papaver somniferum]
MHWRDIVPCLPIFFFFPPQTMTLAMAIDSHETTVFRSKLPDISISNNIPLHRYCFENISEFNDKPCLITGSNGRIYSYNETHLLCHKTAAGLSKLGVKKVKMTPQLEKLWLPLSFDQVALNLLKMKLKNLSQNKWRSTRDHIRSYSSKLYQYLLLARF